MISKKILFVDDERNVLDAFQRQLRNQYQMDTAQGGPTAINTIKANGPYAVIVVDMRMPVMDGIQLLGHIKKIAPETVRIMLTGKTDEKTAIDAINEGNIFRFLTKPCPPELLRSTLNAGLEQYRLVFAEKELLEKTLSGSVKMLTEILSLVNPVAFGKAARLRRYVNHIAGALSLQNVWKYELAAMLSQIGCVTIAPETLEKVYRGDILNEQEVKAYATHIEVAAKLLANIPRLEAVAAMIAKQCERPINLPIENLDSEDDGIATGAQLLKVSLGFDDRLQRGKPKQEALMEMQTQQKEYNRQYVQALATMNTGADGVEIQMIRTFDLRPKMILDEDIRAKNGLLVIARGQEITYSVLEILTRYANGVGLKEPFRVLVPAEKRGETMAS